MNLLKQTIVALMLGTLASASHAVAILVTDLNFGTDSVIRDVDNGRDFLRLSETVGLTYSQVIAELATTYAGWEVASGAQLDDLAVSAGIRGSGLPATDPAVIAAAARIRDWMCPAGTPSYGLCPQDTGIAVFVRGLVSDPELNPFTPGLEAYKAYSFGVYTSGPSGYANLAGYGYTNHYAERTYLTRISTDGPVTAVSEPSSLVLMSLGLLGLLFLKRRRQGRGDV